MALHWEYEKGEVESIDLNPLDVISFPPDAIRRFESVTLGPYGENAILMFVTGSDSPKAEFTDAAMNELEDVDVLATQILIGHDRIEFCRANKRDHPHV
jgi:hypothetical protein